MNTLRVGIVEDEPLARQRLARLVGALPSLQIVGQADNPADAARMITTVVPDVVLLDIELGGQTAFDLIDAIGDVMPLVVFVTAYDGYAIKAFEAAAIDYVLKPVDAGRLAEALDRARTRVESDLVPHGERARAWRRIIAEARRRERIALRESGRTYLVNEDDVIWIEAKRNYCLVHFRDRTVAIREAMERLHERLPRDTFARVHRSAIVNVDHIQYLEPWFRGEHVVVLDDSTRLTTSRAYSASLEPFLSPQRGSK
jgi:two-component system LytT family response regulator